MIEKLLVEIQPALHDLCGHLMLTCLGKCPSNGRCNIKTSSETFGNSVIFDVRKTKEEKNNGFDGNVILVQWLDLLL